MPITVFVISDIILQELRMAFDEEARTSDRSRLLLSVSVPCDEAAVDNGYEVDSLAPWVTFICSFIYLSF